MGKNFIKRKKQIKGLQCLNCGAPLRGDENFCPYCGQKNDVRPLSIKLYFNNLISNFFTLDGRIWRTIYDLVRYPGKVPSAYIAGKRVTYNNPFKLLLQVSIVYFLLGGLFDSFHQKSNPDFINTNLTISESKVDYIKYFDSIDLKTGFTGQLKNKAIAKKVKDSLLQSIIDNSPKEFTFNKGIIKTGFFNYDDLMEYLHSKGIDYEYFPLITGKDKFENSSFFEKVISLYNVVGNDIYKNLSDEETLQKTGIKNTLPNQLAVKFAKRMYLLFRDANSRKQLQKAIISKISLALFFILPVLTLLFQLFYYKKQTYTGTLIFIFYIQSVYFLVLTVELISQHILPLPVDLLISFTVEIWFVYYLYRSTLIFYRQKKWSNALKLIFLVFPSYLLLSGTGFLIITLISMVL